MSIGETWLMRLGMINKGCKYGKCSNDDNNDDGYVGMVSIPALPV